MLIALHEKMAGAHNDDVIRTVLQETHPAIVSQPSKPPTVQKSRRTRQPIVIEVEEEWTEDRERQAQEAQTLLAALEEEPLDPLAQDPLAPLSLTEPPKAGRWGDDDPFAQMTVPGSIRTSIPGIL